MARREPSNAETKRIEALKKYKIMDTKQEKIFDQIAKSAAVVAKTKNSAICFIDSEKQFVKATHGFENPGIITENTLCQYFLDNPKQTYIANMKNENETVRNLAGEQVTYVGTPIRSADGKHIGMICVFDNEEVEIDDRQLEFINLLAEQITTTLELRKDHIETLNAHDSSEVVINNISEGFWDWHIQDDYEFMSPLFWKQLGYDPKTKKHHPSEWQELIHPESKEYALKTFDKHVKSKGKERFKVDVQYKHAKGHWHWIRREGQVIEWKNDEPVRAVGTHTDIHTEKLKENTEEIALEIQSNYIHNRENNFTFFNFVLSKLLEISDSEYGFVGEVRYKEDRTPYLKTFALTDISWDHETAQFYRNNAEIGVEFFNMETLFGEVITSGTRLLINDPANHPKSAGTPQGHPGLNAFMGIPFYFQGEMIGMVGLANRKEGYTEDFYQSIKKVFEITAEVIGNFLLNRKIEQSNKSKVNDFEQILSATPSCLKIVKKDGSLHKMNPQGLELIGAKSMEEVQGACVYDLVAEEHREEWIKFNQSICDGLTQTHRFEIISLDGTRRWMETYAAPFKLSDGEMAHIAITNDITQRLREEESNKFILDTMKVGTWDWDILNNQLYWDEANFRVFGTTPDKFGGAYEAWEATLHPDYKEEVTKNLEQVLKNDSEYNAIFPIVVNDETRYVGAKAIIVRDDNGAPVKMYGINWDRTEEHLLSLQLDEEKKVSYHNAKLASLGELAAGIGHEINNPMAIISGNREIIEHELSKENVDREKIKTCIERIETSVDRVTTIVNGLKTFSRIDENTFQRFDLTDLLTETTNLIGDLYKQDGLEIEFDFDSSLYIEGTKGRVQQVIINLLNNARDAMEASEKKKIEVQIEKGIKSCTIAVKDYGAGIPVALQHKVFDPFFTSKDVNKGTGIGLSLCHRIMGEHNGEITFSSSEGVGTTFYLNFPLAADQADKNEDSSIKEAKNDDSPIEVNNRGHVLLADDEEDLRDLIEYFLENAGFTVTLATNGEEALNMYLEAPEKYDLIMSDLKMPKMDGIEFITNVAQARPQDSHLKIMIMTGGINQNYEDKDSEIGKIIDACLSKPFAQEDLYKLLDEMFPLIKELAS